MPGPWCFAWAGGTIQELVTLVTTGNTHGAPIQTVAIVGDTQGQQIVNLASHGQLEIGTLYTLTGPGIASGTFFIYDTSTVVGAEGSINLSEPSVYETRSATFLATKASAIAGAIGSVSGGSVTFAEIPDLLAGAVYSIAGDPIGETDAPRPTGTTGDLPPVLVPSAYFTAGSGTVAMKVLVATPHISSSTDSMGQLVERTTYTVAEQEVRAIASGEFPLSIGGAPNANSTTITAIPAGALDGLVPGRQYNITGNGLQISTTFIAPGPSATQITIDLPATSSQLNAFLTITGPRTPNAPFDPTVHNRFDEDVIGVEIAQTEGDFATLQIELKNPRVGLLALGRNLWCWLSFDTNWPNGPPSLVPLFNGRLVGIPKLQTGEIVHLEFIARPDDYNAQKLALGESMRVLPYYDPVWLYTDTNPDTVLETYSKLWHTDRVSLELTASDILAGEDGIIDIAEATAFYEGFSLNYGQPPLVAVTVSGTVSWDQEADGAIDVTEKLVRGFAAAGSPYPHAFAAGAGAIGARLQSFYTGGGLISTLNGNGLMNDWPKPGTSIGAGWSLAVGNDRSGYPWCYILDATKLGGGWLQNLYYNVAFSGPAPTQANPDIGAILSSGIYTYTYLVSVFKTRMVLRYAASRRRTENVTAVLAADVQREVSDSSESDRQDITLTSEYVSQGIDPGGAVPIGNLAYRSYFQTDRGARSLEYLLLLARAKVRARARAVDVTFGVDFRTAIGITLRHSVHYNDRRLPGGEAIGKVKSYRIIGGAIMRGEFTIGCAIGNGGSITVDPAENDYVEDDYVEDGYLAVDGQLSLVDGELAYQSLDDFVIDDDGVNLSAVTPDSVVNECIVSNGLTTQVEALKPYAQISTQGIPTMIFGGIPGGSPNNVIRTLHTTVTLDLKPMTGSEFHTIFTPAVSQLALPKTIDLATPAELVESDWDSGESIWDSGASDWDVSP